MIQREKQLDGECDILGPPTPPENREDYFGAFPPLMITIGGVVLMLLVVLGILLFGRLLGV